MSQQINLLQQTQKQHQQAPGPLYIALGAVALAVLVIFIQGTGASEKTAALRRQVDAGAARLTQFTATIQGVQAKQAATLAANPLADAATLQARADSARQMLAAVGQGGTPAGFSRQLAALNTAAVEGVWLTAVEMGKSGTQVSLAGGGVSSAAVMQYATRVNQTFRPLGVRFNTVEVNPQGPAGPDQAPAIVLFKLS
jgi:hypothetical protein